MPWERIVSLRILRVTAFAPRTLSSPSSSSTDGPRRVIPRSSSSRARARRRVVPHFDRSVAPRGGDGSLSLSLSLSLFVCVHTLYVDSDTYRVSEERRMDMDRLDRTPPPTRTRSRDVRTPISGTTGGPRLLLVLVLVVLVVVVVVVVRTRRRFAPAMSATAQFSSSAITGCVSARRSASPRLARGVVSPTVDRSRLDRIRARGKIRGANGNDGIQPNARLSRSVTTTTTRRMHACIFYAFDARRASHAPRSHRAWIGAHARIRTHSTDARARATADRRIVPPRRGGVDVDDSRERILVRRIGFAPRAARTPADARPSPRAHPRNRCGCPAPPRPRT